MGAGEALGPDGAEVMGDDAHLVETEVLDEGVQVFGEGLVGVGLLRWQVRLVAVAVAPHVGDDDVKTFGQGLDVEAPFVVEAGPAVDQEEGRAASPWPGRLADVVIAEAVDGGVLVVMSGQTHLPEVYERLTQYEDLQYRWTVAYLMPGKTDVRVWGRTIWNRWKPVVVLTKGQPRGDWTIDVVTSPEADKQHHVWGQSLQGIVGLIDAFVLPESRILDPFVGGGTTIDAAINSGHTCVGIDNDPVAIEETLNRLNGRLT